MWDVVAAARYLESQSPEKGRIQVVGEGNSAALAAYAGLLEPEIAGVLLANPLLTHADAKAPQFLSVLRVCDVPEVLGMLAPKPLAMVTGEQAELDRVKAIYDAAGAAAALTVTGASEHKHQTLRLAATQISCRLWANCRAATCVKPQERTRSR